MQISCWEWWNLHFLKDTRHALKPYNKAICTYATGIFNGVLCDWFCFVLWFLSFFCFFFLFLQVSKPFNSKSLSSYSCKAYFDKRLLELALNLTFFKKPSKVLHLRLFKLFHQEKRINYLLDFTFCMLGQNRAI